MLFFLSLGMFQRSLAVAVLWFLSHRGTAACSCVPVVGMSVEVECVKAMAYLMF